jgi:hypothetical protein
MGVYGDQSRDAAQLWFNERIGLSAAVGCSVGWFFTGLKV